jgi:hypothetical protein
VLGSDVPGIGAIGSEAPRSTDWRPWSRHATALIDAHVRRSGYRRRISRREWLAALEHADVFSVCLSGATLAAHVVIRDDSRARLLFSATADRSTRETKVATAIGSRFLHWHELLHYHERGFAHYDLGGVVLDPRSPLYTISEFKRSFGGTIVYEESLRLAREPALGSVLRAASGVRLVVRCAVSAT